jgi:flagellar basal-body rod protein FlgC
MAEPGLHAGLRISAAGLSAQRLKMNIVSQNIANAETTRTDAGGPYRRKLVHFSGTDFAVRLAERQSSTSGPLSVTHGKHFPMAGLASSIADPGDTLSVRTQVVETEALGPLVHDPNHPDANADGYVRYPAVNIVLEMTDMLEATRAYEANATALEAAKNMALRALDI